jgi:uncharacterized protein YbjT (DUF2867 family)
VILVAGATGAVGSALLPELRDRPVRALVRREFDGVRLREQGVEAVAGDVVEGRGLDEAMRGIDTLVYLVHTLDRPGDIVANDLEAVQNVLLAARAAGVQRVIYLGAVGSSEEATSAHLVARWATELAVRQSELDWAVLRTPLIIGAGSTLFELMRRFVDRSPVVPMFRWRRTEVEPVALADVTLALRMTLDDPSLSERVFEVCGPERITFGDVVRGWGHAAGKRRIWLPLPGWGEGVQEQLAWTLARLPRRETRHLLETLRTRQVCTDPSLRFPLPQRPQPLSAALAAVFESGG